MKEEMFFVVAVDIYLRLKCSVGILPTTSYVRRQYGESVNDGMISRCGTQCSVFIATFELVSARICGWQIAVWRWWNLLDNNVIESRRELLRSTRNQYASESVRQRGNYFCFGQTNVMMLMQSIWSWHPKIAQKAVRVSLVERWFAYNWKLR